MLAKFSELDAADPLIEKAEEAFRRAFDLNPDLPLAHNLYTYMEVERGRARDAMTRLLRRAHERSADPELYAGLVHACRYCGLLEASIAAHDQARRLDPGIRTSVAHAFFFAGQFERAIQADQDFPPYVSLMAQAMLGRDEEALALCRECLAREPASRQLMRVVQALEAVLDRRVEDGIGAIRDMLRVNFNDPEGWYYWARASARLGDGDLAIDLLARAVRGGFHCARALETDGWLDLVRGRSEFRGLAAAARAAHRDAAQAFVAAGGDRILGAAASA